MEVVRSKVPFNYKSIKVTQGRIDKGLLAIPVSMAGEFSFPGVRCDISVVLGGGDEVELKSFTPGVSSSREMRIGGLKGFYEAFGVSAGDEVVVQELEGGRYRILTDREFERLIGGFERGLDLAEDEEEAGGCLDSISKFSNLGYEAAVLGEFCRLANGRMVERGRLGPGVVESKRNVSAAFRKILGVLYEGRCQLTGFGFVMGSGENYFELHHIRPELEEHPKNLLVVCPNVHAQFTYARLGEVFDDFGWLREVVFNEDRYRVNHHRVVDGLSWSFEKEVHLV